MCNFFCQYIQVLSDTTKKRDYDEQLRKEEYKSVAQKSSDTSSQVYMQFEVIDFVAKDLTFEVAILSWQTVMKESDVGEYKGYSYMKFSGENSIILPNLKCM